MPGYSLERRIPKLALWSIPGFDAQMDLAAHKSGKELRCNTVRRNWSASTENCVGDNQAPDNKNDVSADRFAPPRHGKGDRVTCGNNDCECERNAHHIADRRNQRKLPRRSS